MATPILDLVLQVASASMAGNGDLHAKNYSLQWRPGGIVPETPVFDVVSTFLYPLNQRIALRLDGRDDEMVRRCEPGMADLGRIGYDAATTTRLATEIRRRVDTLRPHIG